MSEEKKRPALGRPPKGDEPRRAKFTLRLTERLKRRAMERASDRGIHLSDLVVDLLERELREASR